MVAIWVPMARARKTWTEKLADSKGLPKIIEIDPVKSKRWGEGTMVIPSPLEVDAVIRKVFEALSPLAKHMVNAHENVPRDPILETFMN